MSNTPEMQNHKPSEFMPPDEKTLETLARSYEGNRLVSLVNSFPDGLQREYNLIAPVGKALFIELNELRANEYFTDHYDSDMEKMKQSIESMRRDEERLELNKETCPDAALIAGKISIMKGRVDEMKRVHSKVLHLSEQYRIQTVRKGRVLALGLYLREHNPQ